MQRMSEIWSMMVDWMDANWGKPMFQLVQGLILGAAIVAGVALVVKGLKREDNDEHL